MALSNETSKTVFNCTGGTTYDFDFKVFEAADLEVIRVTAAGVESTLVLTTGYSVSALTETGGRVTTVSTYSDGNLIVRRKQSKKQEIDYTQNDAFSTPVLEEQLDKTVMMIQEVKEQVGRCIQMPAITEEGDVPDYADLIDTATVAAQDAADDASDSEVAAAASAAAAAVSAGAATTNGAAQVALAAAQVGLATTQADNAATSADEAAASAASAAEIVGGTIKASQAEAEATTDDLKYMTPLQVKNEVQKSGAVLIPAANVVLTGKQDALGYTPENVSNKDTDGTLAANSDTKYPSQKAVKTYADNVLNRIYPVGIVVTLGVSTNPATLFGIGTWVAIAGKVIVGLNAAETEFDTLDETGGEKTHALSEAELATHGHNAGTLTGGAHTHGGVIVPVSGETYKGAMNDPAYKVYSGTSGSGGAVAVTGASATAGSGTAHNNLQPYIVKYVWQRTA